MGSALEAIVLRHGRPLLPVVAATLILDTTDGGVWRERLDVPGGLNGLAPRVSVMPNRVSRMAASRMNRACSGATLREGNQ